MDKPKVGSNKKGDVDEKKEDDNDQNKLNKYFRELAIDEKHYGSDHPSVANTLNNMGSVYAKQGKNEEALSYCRRSLSIKEKHYGSDHPKVADTLRDIAEVYVKQGNNEEALAYGNCLLM